MIDRLPKSGIKITARTSGLDGFGVIQKHFSHLNTGESLGAQVQTPIAGTGRIVSRRRGIDAQHIRGSRMGRSLSRFEGHTGALR